MACLLIEARDAASAARLAGQSALNAAVLETWSPATGHSPRMGSPRTSTAAPRPPKDARRIARRFLAFEDLILRFATRPDLDIFTNNEAERTIRPVKVQQRSSGGAWRTLDRARRLRDRPVLPVHCRQIGHQQTRRPPRPLQRPRLATAWHRTIWITHPARVPRKASGHLHALASFTRGQRLGPFHLPVPAGPGRPG